MKKITFFLFFALPLFVVCQNRYKIIYDQTLSASAGANNLLSIHKGFYEAENLYLKPILFREDIVLKKSAGIFYRLGKTIFVDNVIDHIIILSQHEVFGHGGRYREFGYKNSSYHFNLVPPYGDGSGWASSGSSEPGRLFSKHESITKVLSGNAANTILADELAFTWMMRGTIHYRESYLYMASFHNLTSYIIGTKYFKTDKPGNDINAYLMDININEGQGKYSYTINDLNKFIVVNFLNPFQYFVAFNYTKKYLWDGKETGTFPTIKISEFQYLPSFHLELSPFGAELYFDNYLKKNDKVGYLYFRQGENTFHTFSGGGFRLENIFNNTNISIGAKGDIWKQPEMILGGDKLTYKKAGLGGSASLNLHVKIGNRKQSDIIHLPFNIFTQIGYKTAGFLKEEALAPKFIFRIGLSFDELLR